MMRGPALREDHDDPDAGNEPVGVKLPGAAAQLRKIAGPEAADDDRHADQNVIMRAWIWHRFPSRCFRVLTTKLITCILDGSKSRDPLSVERRAAKDPNRILRMISPAALE